jgi:hypothetical protein
VKYTKSGPGSYDFLCEAARLLGGRIRLFTQEDKVVALTVAVPRKPRAGDDEPWTAIGFSFSSIDDLPVSAATAVTWLRKLAGRRLRGVMRDGTDDLGCSEEPS